MSDNRFLQSLAIVPVWVAGLGVALTVVAYLTDAGGHVPLGVVVAIVFGMATMFLALIGLFASFKAGRKSWGFVNLVLLCVPAMLWLAISADL